MEQLRDILEALIFVHRGVLSPRAMEEVLHEDFSHEQIREALTALKAEYESRGGALALLDVAGGYQFGTREEMAEWIQKLDYYQHHRHLSRPTLETLAIIAYKQPITRPEIEALRGVSVDGIVRNLLEKKLIRILGRKDVPGKPIVFGTSREFLLHFGLNSLSDLPSLKEFEEQAPPAEDREAEGILPFEEGGESSPEPPEQEGRDVTLPE